MKTQLALPCLLMAPLRSACFCIGLAFLANPAAAAPEDDRVRQAAALFGKGNEAADAGRHAAAYRAYRESWDLVRDYKTAANLAMVEIELHRWTDAANHIAYTLAHTPIDEAPDRLNSLYRAFEGVKARISELRLERVPAEATVILDDISLNSQDRRGAIFVTPGQHRLVVRLEGKAPHKEEFETVAGEKRTLVVVLEPLEALNAPVSSAAPPTPHPAAPQVSPVDRHAASGIRTSTIIAFAGGAVAVGGATLGIIFQSGANRDDRDADLVGGHLTAAAPDACSTGDYEKQCALLKVIVALRDERQKVAIGGFVLAGIGLSTMLTTLLLRDNPNEVTLSLSGLPHKRQADASLSFRF